MDVQSIGNCAGVIWKLLNGEHRKWSYNEIKKSTGLSDREINAAIGWLAREGKLNIEETQQGKRNILYIELNFFIG
ncbi:Protein of uncharacterised function (DUF2582) [uncultured Bacteroides sp.]|uniref:winged helix-turn-helix domain-containing protein n=1 Tax=Bacteroides TaxID=816 RepID=UPI00082187EC|nr:MULTISPECIES: winged helix-turn-helix domain-containing protein [Bacteroides]MCF2738211.1 winged helix-turn-helix domain-containing protein [Bacteroides caecigallinarum]MCR8893927.1 winged helix-turn-helix domain-containing protein [Bacteroides sp. ET336]MCU6771113.1 winged helix-turn-helix domain-containing protein [Bacteroides cellulolyticus]MDN0051541.1 winged helix-turn-helix domain-containing protein [Bacteroides caecigallinarum]MDN0058424.1 winged helix-turn-helix domain-containing pr